MAGGSCIGEGEGPPEGAHGTSRSDGFPHPTALNRPRGLYPPPPMRRLVPLLVCAAALAGCKASDAPPPKTKVQGKIQPSFDPVPDLQRCLGGKRIENERTGPYDVRVGPKGEGMHIRVAPTPADADASQLRGQAEGAEVVRRIIFFVGTAPDDRVEPVEGCVDSVADKYS